MWCGGKLTWPTTNSSLIIALPLELGEALKEANGVLVSADMNSMSPWCQ